jgi:hypothetical protein
VEKSFFRSRNWDEHRHRARKALDTDADGKSGGNTTQAEHSRAEANGKKVQKALNLGLNLC